MKKKERQDKAEMEKKKLMIKEIRMLEAELIENKNNNKVQLDLTTTAGHELLGKILKQVLSGLFTRTVHCLDVQIGLKAST